MYHLFKCCTGHQNIVEFGNPPVPCMLSKVYKNKRGPCMKYFAYPFALKSNSLMWLSIGWIGSRVKFCCCNGLGRLSMKSLVRRSSGSDALSSTETWWIPVQSHIPAGMAYRQHRLLHHTHESVCIRTCLFPLMEEAHALTLA
jgi:hypothetical protein